MSEPSTDAVPRFVPDWPACLVEEGCTGRQIHGHERCLAHLPDDDLDACLENVRPGASFDLRGTTLTAELLQRLLHQAAADPAAANPPRRVGEADFRFCTFLGRADFGHVQFTEEARFHGAQFRGPAVFHGARFAMEAVFQDAQFAKGAMFHGAQFAELARFHDAQFAEEAWFIDVLFRGTAGFYGAQFTGTAKFSSALFAEQALFIDVLFRGPARFNAAQFTETAGFHGAQFRGPAVFDGAQFTRAAVFQNAQFSETAIFRGAQLRGPAAFNAAQFTEAAVFQNALFVEQALFDDVRFMGPAEFNGARFMGPARFVGARFEVGNPVGPLLAKRVDMTRVSFEKRVVVEVEAGAFLAADARFEEGVELRVRYAFVDLRRVSFGGPSSLSGVAEPFTDLLGLQLVADQELITEWAASTIAKPVAGRGGARLEPWVPSLVSVQETDVSQLTVADVDLGWCRFAGTHQLDKLRLEARSPFSRPPRGWRAGWAWLPVWRWSPRRVLAEEHPWRARRHKSGGWYAEIPYTHKDDVAARQVVGPERLAVLYRSLRKAAEDGKNEAGAGDFYYGEMEARRHASTTGRGERALLSLYWMISGYGQRAGRTLTALVLLIGVLFALLTQFGLPASTAVQQMTATVPAAAAGQDREITVDVKPVTPALPPQDQRWTADRMDKAIRIAVGSVVFRDSGTPLTRTGTWTVMAGRALGPLLLALAALAIRARVKR